MAKAKNRRRLIQSLLESGLDRAEVQEALDKMDGQENDDVDAKGRPDADAPLIMEVFGPGQ